MYRRRKCCCSYIYIVEDDELTIDTAFSTSTFGDAGGWRMVRVEDGEESMN